MSEWKPFDTAPKDGTYFLACTEEDVFLIQWEKDRTGWRCSPGHSVFVKFTHWMEAPELPVKRHSCIEGNVKCTSRLDDNLYLMEWRCTEWHDISWVKFCPFCGEKA
jgi:hypothetical protein